MKKATIHPLVLVLAIVVVAVLVASALGKQVLPSLVAQVKEATSAMTQSDGNFSFSYSTRSGNKKKAAQTLTIDQSLENVTQASVSITQTQGQLTVDGTSQSKNITGESSYTGQPPVVSFLPSGQLTIKSQGTVGENHTLHLPSQTPIVLQSGLGSGSIDIDLTSARVPTLQISSGTGSIKVRFSGTHSTTAMIATGTGSISLEVPPSVGVRFLAMPNAVTQEDLGEDYIQVGKGYQSKNYNTATVKVNLSIAQAQGTFSLTEVE